MLTFNGCFYTIETMLIYRIEHSETGKGPMHGGGNCMRWDLLFYDHPVPHEHDDYCEFMKTRDEEEYFFASTSQNWLQELMQGHFVVRHLGEHGYKVLVYDVQDDFVVFGDQVAFNKEKATVVSVNELDRLWNLEI